MTHALTTTDLRLITCTPVELSIFCPNGIFYDAVDREKGGIAPYPLLGAVNTSPYFRQDFAVKIYIFDGESISSIDNVNKNRFMLWFQNPSGQRIIDAPGGER